MMRVLPALTLAAGLLAWPLAAGAQSSGPAGQVAGQVRILPAIADTHVYAYSWKGWNAANWGRYDVLGAGWHPVGGEKRTFIRFDLAGINAAQILSAKLRLFHYHTAGRGTEPLGVFRVTQPWIEGRGTYKPATRALPGETTWQHQPGFDPRPVTSFTVPRAPGQWVTIDITGLARAWASGMPNHGLMLRPLGRPTARDPEAQYGFYARERREADKRPQLVLVVRSGGTGMPGGTVTPGGPGTSGGRPPAGITWDFETGNLVGWTRTGTAFDFQPTFGDNPTARGRGQPSRHQGNYWIGGFEKYQGRPGEKPGTVQGDGPVGTLTSRAFRVPSGKLSFLIGGGGSPRTRVELLVDGRPVRSASGHNTESMDWVTWDLTPWAGRRGQIRVVDNSSGGWGHINVDDFQFSASGP